MESPRRSRRDSDSGWQEWLIAICVTALSLLGIWTVFGDDLIQLFQPPAGTSSASQNPVK